MVTLSQVRTQIADRPQLWPASAEPPELIGQGDGEATLFRLRFENVIPGTLTLYTGAVPASGSAAAPIWTAISTKPVAIVATTSNGPVNGPGGYTITPASMANIANGVPLVVDVPPNQEIVAARNCTPTTFDASFTMGHQAGFAVIGGGAYLVGDPDLGLNGTGASNAFIAFATAPTTGQLIGARYEVTAFSDDDLQGYLTRAQALYPDDVSVLKRVQYDMIDVICMDYDRLLIMSQGDYRKDTMAYADSLKQLKAGLRQDLSGGPVPGAAVPVLSIGSQTTRRYQPWR